MDDEAEAPDAATPLTDAQRALVVEHLDLVEEKARHLRSTFPALPFEELVSFGYLGLVRAAKTYRPGSATPFSAFASIRIRGQIIDDVRRLSRYSERQQDRRKEVRRAEQLLEQRRLKKDLSETVEQLMDFLAKNPAPQYVGFEATAGVAASETSPETAVHYARIRERVRKAAAELGTEERALVSKIYFRNMNLQDAADHIGLTKSWASRLHARALKILQAAFRREDS